MDILGVGFIPPNSRHGSKSLILKNHKNDSCCDEKITILNMHQFIISGFTKIFFVLFQKVHSSCFLITFLELECMFVDIAHCKQFNITTFKTRFIRRKKCQCSQRSFCKSLKQSYRILFFIRNVDIRIAWFFIYILL